MKSVKDTFQVWITDIRFIVFIGFSVRIVYVFFSIAHDQVDTTFQGTEMSYNLIHSSRSDKFIPWEFETETRSYLWPLILLIPIRIALFFGLEGLEIFLFLRFLASLFSLVAILSVYRMFEKSQVKSINGVVSAWIIAIFYPIVYFSTKISVDAIAITLLIITISRLELTTNKSTEMNWFLTGFLIGFTISLRYQFMLIWIFYLAKQLVNRVKTLILGTSTGLLPLFFVDIIFYGNPFITLWNFFKFNILEEGSGEFGTQPWYFYIPVIFLYFSGFSVFVILKLLHISKSQLLELQIHYLLAGFLSYLTIFQIIPHKDFNFISPAIIGLLVVSFYGIESFIEQWRLNQIKRVWKILVTSIMILSLIGIIIFGQPTNKSSNLWMAQHYVSENYSSSDVMIMGPHTDTGGNLLQFPNSGSNRIIAFENFLSLVNFLSNDQILILNENHEDYLISIQYMVSLCPNLIMIKEFKSIYVVPFFDSIESAIFDFLVGSGLYPHSYLAEVWSC